MPTEKNHVYGGLAGRLASGEGGPAGGASGPADRGGQTGGASVPAATACDRSMTGGEMAGPVPLTAPLREFCAENMTGVRAAINAGVGRIELCNNLAVGGTTPSAGIMRQTARLAHANGVSVMCMVRPRGGDFEYTRDEVAAMREDIEVARRAGADGVVLGCLRGGQLDRDLTLELVRLAQETMAGAYAPMDVTFHMAFDELPEDEKPDAIRWLAGIGVKRILTHGGAAGTPIADNYERLRSYVTCAEATQKPSMGGLAALVGEDRSIRILPGGGITWENAREVAEALGVDEVHGTRIVRM